MCQWIYWIPTKLLLTLFSVILICNSLTKSLFSRTIQYNMLKMRDRYLHTNCLAALANMSGLFKHLHPYVAQRLVSLFETLARLVWLIDCSSTSTPMWPSDWSHSLRLWPMAGLPLWDSGQGVIYMVLIQWAVTRSGLIDRLFKHLHPCAGHLLAGFLIAWFGETAMFVNYCCLLQ